MRNKNAEQETKTNECGVVGGGGEDARPIYTLNYDVPPQRQAMTERHIESR
jgi:hypothetical protein